jgi:hypothetical protein
VKLSNLGIALIGVCLFSGPAVRAQAQSSGNQNVPAASVTVVPQLIKFSGTLLDAQNKPIATGPVSVTFAFYAEQTGGASLWLETQDVRPDENGYYTVLIGSETSTGVSMELFASGEARWLGIQIERQPEQARVLLVSVPYALKAADAETIGGLPPSAFVLANQAQSAGGESKTGKSDSASVASVSSTSMSTHLAMDISGLTTGVIPQAGSATTIVNSSPQCDTITNSGALTCAGNIVAGSSGGSGFLEAYNTAGGGVQYGSGSWFDGVGYVRPATPDEGAFDVMGNGGTLASPKLAWEDICQTDIVAHPTAYYCLDLGWKNVGFASLSTVFAGTSGSKNLAIQDQQGGFVSIGTNSAFPNMLYVLDTIGTGSNGGVSGEVDFRGSTAGIASLVAPASVTTNYKWVLPTAAATGIVRGANSSNVVTLSQSELSGDAITSGSNAVRVVSINGTSLAGLSSGILYNTTGTGVPSIATATQVNTAIQALTGCNTATYVYTPQAGDCVAPGGGTGTGTVTSFSAGNLSPLFTTSVATATTTPALTFALSNAAQNSVFAGPATGGAGAPSYQTAPAFSAANLIGLPLSGLTTQAADTVDMNASGSTASPTAIAMPPCSASGHADVYDPSTHTWTCNSISDGGLSPATFWQQGGYTTGAVTIGTAEDVLCSGWIVPPGGLSVGHVIPLVRTGEANSDIGFYSVSGTTATLEAHTGAVTFTTSVSASYALSGGTQTLTAGPTLYCYTSESASFALVPSGNTPSWFSITNEGALGSSGVLPNSIALGVSSNPNGQAYGPAFILLP